MPQKMLLLMMPALALLAGAPLPVQAAPTRRPAAKQQTTARLPMLRTWEKRLTVAMDEALKENGSEGEPADMARKCVVDAVAAAEKWQRARTAYLEAAIQAAGGKSERLPELKQEGERNLEADMRALAAGAAWYPDARCKELGIAEEDREEAATPGVGDVPPPVIKLLQCGSNSTQEYALAAESAAAVCTAMIKAENDALLKMYPTSEEPFPGPEPVTGLLWEAVPELKAQAPKLISLWQAEVKAWEEYCETMRNLLAPGCLMFTGSLSYMDRLTLKLIANREAFLAVLIPPPPAEPIAEEAEPAGDEEPAAQDMTPEQLRRASEADDPNAQWELGERLLNGRDGFKKNTKEAVKWLEKSAKQGHCMAAFRLSECYRNGIGIAKDVKKADYWLEQSGDDMEAQGCEGQGGEQ
ncbi:MAG: sel1 repeat family protein [Akkermansia muciniphila]|nr:sel1 repeat family protein [Akkermansia muciniphila]